jgi:hypothetical protein
MNGSDLLLITLPIILVLFAVFGLNPLHKKNTEKLQQNKPIDGQTISTNNITGNAESIHPWGRTEVVPMKSIELEYFEFCDEWVMSGEVVQPVDRKDYFMPVLKGHLDLNVKDLTQTWIEYGGYATGPETDAETYEDFRMAHIKVNSGKVINIKYSHYRLDQNKTWSIIAVWEARFNENF